MTQGQKTVLALLIGIALLELGFTQRFGQLWQLAFNQNAAETGRDREGGGDSTDGANKNGFHPGNHNPSPSGGHVGQGEHAI